MKDILLQLEQEQDPHVKIDLLIQVSKGFLNSDLERCEDIAMELLAIGQNNDLPVAVMHHFLVMGRINYRRGQLEDSKNYFANGEKIAREINNQAGIANSNEAFGLILNKQGLHAEALDLILKALAIYQDTVTDKSMLGLPYNNIANTYNYLGQTTEAESYYRLAIEAMENSDRQQHTHLIKGNLGLLLFQREQHVEAIINFKSALEGFIATNNVQAQSQAYNHIGNCYVGLNDLVKGLEYFQKALKIIRSRDFPTELSSIYQGLGKLYTKLNGHAEALSYFNKALAIRLEKAYWSDACETYLSLYTLNDLTGNTTKANEAIMAGKLLAAEMGIAHWQKQFEEVKA